MSCSSSPTPTPWQRRAEMQPYIMLDLCSGFGGASKSEEEHGWRVIRVDSEPRVRPTVIADIRALPMRPFPVDLLWVSPTCTYYSRYDQRDSLFPGEPEPDHTLYETARAIISEWGPRYWVIENVRGAERFWGRADYRLGSRYLWTNLPMLMSVPKITKWKHNMCSGSDPLRSAKRGYIPYAISDAVRLSVQQRLEALP